MANSFPTEAKKSEMPSREIQDEVESLRGNLVNLRNMVSSLNDRLADVRKQPPAENPIGGGMSGSRLYPASKLGQQVRDLDNMVITLVDDLHDLHSQLAV
jgi:hypothetical protein